MTRYIRRTAPKEEVDKLIPSYCKFRAQIRLVVLLVKEEHACTAPGCKRIIVDPDYLKCLHRPNVSVKWDGIEEIIEEGIKLKTGEVVPLDIIIFGTGYSLVRVQVLLFLCEMLGTERAAYRRQRKR
jgi:cation diffusion facilitator CzcD-associated flavoprotein CzcO